MIEAACEARADRDALAADPGDQGRGLGDADDERFAVLQRVQFAPPVGLGALPDRQLANLRAAAKPLGGEAARSR